jgi:hypothetical protein
MPKLNQILAIETGVKSRAASDLTQAHHALQKTSLLDGQSRTYRALSEEGERFPNETSRVQVKADAMIRETVKILTELFDVVATKDWANCQARADVVVEGRTILADVPVTYLLFLEKQLTDLHTFIKKLPVLDPAYSWKFDPTQDLYATDPVEVAKTKKMPRVLEKAPATKEHPAQVDVYHEDVVVGYWSTIKYSGALPAARVNELLARVDKLAQAVKFAREQANAIEAESRKVGDAVLGYLFS